MPKLDLDIAKAAKRVKEEGGWMIQCGGDLNGYIANYGSKNDAEYSGDGGEAIYAADKATLDRVQEELVALKVKRDRRNAKLGTRQCPACERLAVGSCTERADRIHPDFETYAAEMAEVLTEAEYVDWLAEN